MSFSRRNLSGSSGQVPQPDQLLREGRACHRRIRDLEKDIRQFRKAVLTLWLDQAKRLWIAVEHHGLKGKYFDVFSRQIGIDRSSAYELLKLHPHRVEVIRQCRSDNHWPGQIHAFEAALAGKFEWTCALSIIRSTYLQGVNYALSDITFSRRIRLALPEVVCDQVLSNAADYPLLLWNIAERTANMLARRAIRPVADVAEKERWFED